MGPHPLLDQARPRLLLLPQDDKLPLRVPHILARRHVELDEAAQAVRRARGGVLRVAPSREGEGAALCEEEGWGDVVLGGVVGLCEVPWGGRRGGGEGVYLYYCDEAE
ncbi:hypothetical protein V496_10222 [Pseudogymnoascus sp. VKM F-4515 (FW-2607)]|nr:hypothetical protein V496_10222 [Pseudogymnoascus sp. VKM F-4515 (FW-2607)]